MKYVLSMLLKYFLVIRSGASLCSAPNFLVLRKSFPTYTHLHEKILLEFYYPQLTYVCFLHSLFIFVQRQGKGNNNRIYYQALNLAICIILVILICKWTQFSRKLYLKQLAKITRIVSKITFTFWLKYW